MKLPILSILFVLAGLAPLRVAAEPNADAKLKDLHARTQARFGAEELDLQATATEFQSLIPGVDLSPSEGLPAKAKYLQNLCSILLGELWRKGNSTTEAEQNAVANAIKPLLTKLDGLIDENYQAQPVSANVKPPPGTPNAAAGMNPDAIADPKLRQRYLDAIEQEGQKNLKNCQQQELRGTRQSNIITLAGLPGGGISPKTVLEKFTAAGESRKELEKRFFPDKK